MGIYEFKLKLLLLALLEGWDPFIPCSLAISWMCFACIDFLRLSMCIQYPIHSYPLVKCLAKLSVPRFGIELFLFLGTICTRLVTHSTLIFYPRALQRSPNRNKPLSDACDCNKRITMSFPMMDPTPYKYLCINCL